MSALEAYEIGHDVKQDLNNAFGVDHDDEFASHLLNYFPIEDGFPVFADLESFLMNHDCDDIDVVMEVYSVMEIHFPFFPFNLQEATSFDLAPHATGEISEEDKGYRWHIVTCVNDALSYFTGGVFRTVAHARMNAELTFTETIEKG